MKDIIHLLIFLINLKNGIMNLKQIPHIGSIKVFLSIIIVYRSYLTYANWYLSESGTRKNFGELELGIRQFTNNYIYIKNFERDYGSSVLSLCSNIKKVIYLLL